MASYLPTGLTGGDKFQLVFVTSSSGFSATAGQIGEYNSYITSAWVASTIKASIETYLELSSSIIWKCIGSTDPGNGAGTEDARDNAEVGSGIDFKGVYILNGTKVVHDEEEFWSGTGSTGGIRVPINVDENGSSIGAGTHYVWTGTGGNGTSGNSHYLGYFNDMGPGNPFSEVSKGNADASNNEKWIVSTIGDGELETASLYALSEELTWPADDPPPPEPDEPDEPEPPIPKNLQIKWNSVKNSKYIRFPYESAFDGLVEQTSFVEYTDGYHKKINIEKTQDPTK